MRKIGLSADFELSREIGLFSGLELFRKIGLIIIAIINSCFSWLISANFIDALSKLRQTIEFNEIV